MTLHVDDDLGETWRRSVACRGMDADLFFPVRGQSAALAVATCARCEVHDERAAYALDHGEKFGVWGGLPENRRKRPRWASRRQP